jgi:hypothetical protein
MCVIGLDSGSKGSGLESRLKLIPGSIPTPNFGSFEKSNIGTMCATDLDLPSEKIKFKSLLTTFEASIIF